MVKQDALLKSVELKQQAERVLFELLSRVPGIFIEREPKYPWLLATTQEPDIRMRVSYGDHTFDLISEVKSNGQPRIAYSTIFQLREASAAIMELRKQSTSYNTPILLVLAAPFLSKDVRDLCTREEISYFDLSGNARISFGPVFIEREAADNLFKEVRETRSLFAPKATRILRVMLRDAGSNYAPAWRVIDLADKAKVSLGQVSNISKALVDAGFAKKDDEGITLTEPGKLFNAWIKAYKLPEGETYSFYTTLHGNRLTQGLMDALSNTPTKGRAVLSSFSAASWLAPYMRTGSTNLYADRGGLDRLKSALQLSPAVRGDNVSVKILADDGPLDDAVQAAEGIFCTSPIQTCLDLSWAGDRGQEAAAVLHEKWFSWR